jgi:hypothetical protein
MRDAVRTATEQILRRFGQRPSLRRPSSRPCQSRVSLPVKAGGMSTIPWKFSVSIVVSALTQPAVLADDKVH